MSFLQYLGTPASSLALALGYIATASPSSLLLSWEEEEEEEGSCLHY